MNYFPAYFALIAIAISGLGANTVSIVEKAKEDYAMELQCRSKNGSYLIYKGEYACVKEFITLEPVEL